MTNDLVVKDYLKCNVLKKNYLKNHFRKLSSIVYTFKSKFKNIYIQLWIRVTDT